MYRIKEVVVWFGIPCLAVVSGEIFPWGWRLMSFGIAIIFAIIHVLLINDWGDLKKNPFEKERFPMVSDFVSLRCWLLFFASLSFVVSFIFYANLVPVEMLLFFSAAGLILSLLYSHPKIHLKEGILGATLLHFFGVLLQFMLGYFVFSTSWGKGILFGTFFALIIVCGHFVHECIDVDVDKKGGIQTRATRFGVNQMLIIAGAVFVVSHFYLLVLTLIKIVKWPVNLIFFLPLVVHFVFLRKLCFIPALTMKDIEGYRTGYRLAYALCSIIFVLWRVFEFKNS